MLFRSPTSSLHQEPNIASQRQQEEAGTPVHRSQPVSQPANLPACQPHPCKLSGRPGLHRHLRSTGVTLGSKTDASMPSRSTGPKTRHGSASRTRKSSTDTLQWACNGGYRDSQVPRRIKTSKRSKGSAVRRLAPAQPTMAPYLRGNRGG